MKACLAILALFLPLSTVHAHDPFVGMDAARIMGQKYCLAYSWKGRAETAAVFKFAGHTWVYHPTTGSAIIDGKDPLSIPGSVWTPVHCVRGDTRLDGTACLPLAIAEVKQRGGHIVFCTLNGRPHVRRVP